MEFKLCKKGLPLSLLETYSAFANTDGGIIILGVEELKQGNIIKGVDHAEVYVEQFWNLINNKQKVSANILLYQHVSIQNTMKKTSL